MAINKNQKSNSISYLKDKVSNADTVIIIHYRGMSGKQLYDFRVNLKSKDCGIKIIKNTLALRAIKDSKVESLSSYLKGPTAILYSKDPVSLAKIIEDAKKESPCLEIVAGHLDQSLVDAKTIYSLAKLGSFDQVKSSFLGTLNAVQSNFIRILQAPESGMASLKTE